jgi:hypothetical protein
VLVLPIFVTSVYLSHVNLNPLHARDRTADTGKWSDKGRLSRREPLLGRRRGFREWHQDHRHRDPADLAVEVEQDTASGSEA